MTAATIVLTDEQQNAVDRLVHSGRPIQTLGGYAGTGKTTVIRELVAELPNYAVCAYTGKAADVLRRKGIEASTIHSLIYHPIKDVFGDVTFELIPPQLFTADGIIVDEASMVGKSIYDDLRSFDVPLIFVGDHGQLEPVGGNDFNLMKKPDVVLETVHRNAGEIARFAESLRNGRDAAEWSGADDGDTGVSIVSMKDLSRFHIDRDWQLICAFNKTRCDLNAMIREHLGFVEGKPCVGDRVMCLQNNKEHGLFNGMQGEITELNEVKRILTFVSNQGVEARVGYLASAFGSPTKPEWCSGVIPFDWSYCITCHKAQGDEFDNTCVIEQRCQGWEHRRWAYTAASRAKNKLVWVVK